MDYSPKPNRIEFVDALRGFAIMAIMLLHNIEHFDFYHFPEHLPAWVKALDSKIWDSLFFVFGGKAYAIFALLFGFTFYLMFSKQATLGLDFRARFVWRLAVLLAIGFVNSLFYEGDILTIYATVGLSLALVAKLSTRWVLIIAGILMLQPVEWARLVYIASTPEYVIPPITSHQYFGNAYTYLSGNSFVELIKGNLWNGRLAVLHWSWENGRFFQASALFMLGMLLGRGQYFVYSATSMRFWKRTLIYSSVSFFVLYILKENISVFASREAIKGSLHLIITSLANFAFTLVWVSALFLAFREKILENLLKKLAPLGRMSLTSYVMQSVAGSFIYYGYGLGLYKYTRATYCLLIGIVLFLLQLWFCRWWLGRFGQGPLERLWHKATWIKPKK